MDSGTWLEKKGVLFELKGDIGIFVRKIPMSHVCLNKNKTLGSFLEKEPCWFEHIGDIGILVRKENCWSEQKRDIVV
jgi:hypothetical protein